MRVIYIYASITMKGSLLTMILLLASINVGFVFSFAPYRCTLFLQPFQRGVITSTLNLNLPLTKLSADRASEVEILPKISIEYCTGCRWMLRAAWLSQELLTTFQDDLHSVTMIPSRPPAPGGVFRIKLNNEILIWDRKEEGRFPEAKEVKQRIRDVINPEKSLGHSDAPAREQEKTKESIVETKKGETSGIKITYEETSISTITTTDDQSCTECTEEKRQAVRSMQIQFEELTDEEAEDMRRQYGVW